jgi:predicted transcriptional regulator
VKKLDKKKFGISLKPINMAIVNYFQKNKVATTQEVIEQLKEFTQASIYRAMKEMFDSGIIAVEREEKVHSVIKRHFRLNYDLSSELSSDIKNDRYDDLVNGIKIWISTMNQEISDYLSEWSQTDQPIRMGMYRDLMHVSEDNLVAFVKDVHSLMEKYKALPSTKSKKMFAFSASWVPITNS